MDFRKNIKNGSLKVLASLVCFTGGNEVLWGDLYYYVTQSTDTGSTTSCSECATDGNACCTFLDAIENANNYGTANVSYIYIPSGGVTYTGAEITYQDITNTTYITNNPSVASGQIINFNGATSSEAYVLQSEGSSTVLINTIFQNTGGGTSIIQNTGGTIYISGTRLNGSDSETFSGVNWYMSNSPSFIFSGSSSYADYNVPLAGNFSIFNTTLLIHSQASAETVTVSGNIGIGSGTANLTIFPELGNMIFSGNISVDTVTVEAGTVTPETNVTFTGSNTMSNLNISGTAIFSSAAQLGNGSTTVTLQGGGGNFQTSGSPTLSNPIVMESTGNIKVTSGTTTFSGNVTTSGSGNTYTMSLYPSDGSLIFSGDILSGSNTLNATVNSGGGTVTFSGSNTISSLFIVGTAIVNSSPALGNGSTTVTLQGGGGNFQTSGSPTLSNPIVMESTGNIKVTSGTTTFSGNVTTSGSGNTYTMSLYPSDGSLIFSGDILSGSNTLNATVNSGGGTVTFSGSNTISSLFIAGTAIVNSAPALGNGSTSINFEVGTGILQVSGSPTLSNPIILDSNGSIMVTSGTATFSGNVTTSGSGNTYGMSLLPNSGNMIFSGDILSGSNTLYVTVNSGGGTVALSGNNTISGLFIAGTTIINGAAPLGNGSTSINFEVTEGVLQVSGSPTLSNPVYVTGGLGAFDTTSGTTIFSGTIFGGNGNTLTLTGNNSLGTVNVPSSETFTINGRIATGQNLTKTGSGTLVLTGTSSTYTGATNVDAGLLVVNQTITTSSGFTVGSGAVLSGTGTVTSTQVNGGGAIKGGYLFGTLTVDGTLTLEDGSYFGTVVDLGSVSLVHATNEIMIDSNTEVLLAFEPGTYNKTSAVILSSATGITGEFSGISVNSIAPNFYSGILSYTGTEVLLGLTERNVVDLAVGGNAVQVANGLDAAITYNRTKVSYTISPASDLAALGITLDNGATITASPTPQLADILKSLISFTTEEEMSYALNQLHPAELKGMAISQENNAVRVREALTQRMLNDLDADSCESSNSSHKKDTSYCEKEKRMITTWVGGLGETLKQNNKNNSYGPLTGYRTNTGGFVAGIDALFADFFYAGALGGYTHSHLHFKEGKGTGDVSSGYAGVYLSVLGPQLWGNGYLGDLFFANASVIGSWSEYRADRHIEYTGVNLTAKNHHGGNQLLAHFDTGLNFNVWGLTIRPFDYFDYMTQIERKYHEHNAGQWNLTVQKKNMMMLRNELGLQFAKCYCTSSFKWILSPKFSWVREARVKGDNMSVNFTEGGTQFTIRGYFPDRSLFAPGLALTGFMLQDAVVLDLYYNGEFAGGYSSNSFGGQIGYSF